MPPTTSFFQDGDKVDYTPGVAVNAGDVIVQGDMVGLAGIDLAASRKGALSIEGGFLFPKSAGAIGAGLKLYWDPTNKVASLDSRVGPILGRCAVAALSGDTTVAVILDIVCAPDLLFAAQVAATVITNTNVATKFDQNVTIGAGRLLAGDVIRVRAAVALPATNSTDTLTLALLLGAQAIVTTAAVDVANGDVGLIEADITVRTAGAGGAIAACGSSCLGPPGTAVVKPFVLGNTALDTTAALQLAVQATWSVANAGDQARLDIFNAELLRTN